MGVCTFFDKSMKVLSSILAMATAQWDGFNYDDYSDVGKNQISQVSVQDIAQLNGLSAGTQLNNYNLPNHYLGNGLKCFYCNERSVGDLYQVYFLCVPRSRVLLLLPRAQKDLSLFQS